MGQVGHAGDSGTIAEDTAQHTGGTGTHAEIIVTSRRGGAHAGESHMHAPTLK